MKSQTLLSAWICTATLVSSALAGPLSFDFKDAKGVNNVVFKMDAPLESINGTATGVAGTITFDPANPAELQGKITVATSSMHVGNPMMQEHMLGEQWMDAKKHPELSFEVVKVSNAATTGTETKADVTGKLTMRGVTQEVVIPVRINYLQDKLSARMPQAKGDLLVIRSTFKVKRSDFGINPGAPEDKVSNEVELTLSLAGASPR